MRYIPEADASDEEQALAARLVDKERAALDKWFKGDVSGYADLWSKRSFSYFDAVVRERVDSPEEIRNFLKAIEGKLFAASYEMRAPRVQLSLDMAVLTYQLFADTSLMKMAYNSSRFSGARPMANGASSIPHGPASVPWT